MNLGQSIRAGLKIARSEGGAFLLALDGGIKWGFNLH